MKISKLKNSIIHFYKCSLLVVLVGSTVPAFAQNAAVSTKTVEVSADSLTGKVIDAVTKKALAGAKIQTTNPRVSAMTDENGAFSIKLLPYLRTLIVTAPGYDKKEVAVYQSGGSIEIYIYPSVFSNVYADEITAFGPKRKATISTAIKSFELESQSSYSIDAEFKKQLSGDMLLNIHSGSPATGARMLIRGINSLNSNTQPLIIVDGVIFDNLSERQSLHLGNYLNPLSGLDMNDIQSISVLKDGTSIYGSKAGI